jgi:hypothetical protein
VSEDVIVLGSAGDFAKAFKGAHRYRPCMSMPMRSSGRRASIPRNVTESMVLSQGQHGKYVVVAPAKWRLTGRSSRVPRNSRQ